MQTLWKRYPALGNRDFVKILVGRTLSSIGDQCNLVALNLALYHVTGSVAALAGVLGARVASRLLVQLVAGVLVDRWDRKRMLLVAEALNCLVALSFVWVARPQLLWLTYAAVFCLQSLEGFTSPGLNAGLAVVLTPAELPSGNALRAIGGKLAGFAGPALAGALYVLVGPTPLFVLNGISFLVSFACISSVRTLRQTGANAPQKEPFVLALAGGFRMAARTPQIVGLLVLSATAALMWRVLEIALVTMVRTPLHLGDQGLGYLLTTLAVGGLIGSVLTPLLGHHQSPRLLYLAYGALALPMTLLAWQPVPLVALLSMLLAGMISDTTGVLSTTALQTLVPPSHLGRIFALMNVSTALGVLPLVFGLQPAIAFLGPPGALATAGGLMLVVSLCALVVKRRSSRPAAAV